MSRDEQTDLRIRRTHRFLQEAMIALIAEKGFDAITVGDIAERAMINRATFYRHYQDKYDLVAKIFEETSQHLVETLLPVRKKDGEETPPKFWIRFFAHVEEYAQLYQAMLGKNGSPWFAARMRESIIAGMLASERAWEYPKEAKHQIDPAMPQELPGAQLSYVLIGTIVWWLESEHRYTPKQMATWFHRFAFYGYLAARGYETTAPD